MSNVVFSVMVKEEIVNHCAIILLEDLFLSFLQSRSDAESMVDFGRSCGDLLVPLLMQIDFLCNRVRQQSMMGGGGRLLLNEMAAGQVCNFVCKDKYQLFANILYIQPDSKYFIHTINEIQ